MQGEIAQYPFPSQNTEGGTHTGSEANVTYSSPGDVILHTHLPDRALPSQVPSFPTLARWPKQSTVHPAHVLICMHDAPSTSVTLH